MKHLIITLFFLLFPQAGFGQEMLKSIAPKFKPDPILMEGKIEGNISMAEIVKGKSSKGNCNGYSTEKPTYVLPLSQSFSYLNLKVKGEGLMIMVQGPDGIFCGREEPEISGMWKEGVYQIWIGTQQKTKTKYRLSLSETNQ